MKATRKRDEEAAKELSRFGYAQELVRSMGGFSTFALSFSIISVPTGIFSIYTQCLKSGGPAGVALGWPIVAAGTMIVALAMAELASAFPTAGALYHWSALLGGPGAGWFTAMVNLVGQVAACGAIDLACAQTLQVFFQTSKGGLYAMFALVLASHALVNMVSVRLVAWLNSFSATVQIVGVLAVAGGLLAFARAQPVAFLAHTGFTTRPDGVWVLGFAQASMLGLWTFTGYDASAHVSEETHDPARAAPRGIVTAVAVSAIAGWAIIAAITLAIRDLPAEVEAGSVELHVLDALGARAATATMAVVASAMWFCGLSSITSSSRTLFAFARDHGFPGAARVRLVDPRHGTPRVAIAIVSSAAWALVMCTAPVSDALVYSITVIATMALYVSYAVPIGLGAIARRAGTWTHRGPWQLGGAGVPLAWAAVAWSACVCVLSSYADPLSIAILGGIVAALAALWFLNVRGRFRGPEVTLAAFERRAED